MERLVTAALIHVMITLGVILAIVLPYLRKTILDKIEAFDPKYFYHLLLAAIWTNATVFVAIADWELPTGTFSDMAILMFAFAYGFWGIDGQKIVVQYYRLFMPLEAP